MNIDKTYLGRNVQSFEKGDTLSAVDQVIINYCTDTDGTTYSATAGTHTTGRIVEKTIQTVTSSTVAQSIATALLAKYSSDPYLPVTVCGSELDPAMELGDAMTVNGVYTGIGSITTDFGKGMYADLEAQGQPEEDDFPYINGGSRKAERQTAEIYAKIKVNSDEIELKVSKSGIISAINQSAESITINANKINLTGYVTATDLATSGSTIINGSNITTGTISSDYIKLGGALDLYTATSSSGVLCGQLGYSNITWLGTSYTSWGYTSTAEAGATGNAHLCGAENVFLIGGQIYMHSDDEMTIHTPDSTATYGVNFDTGHVSFQGYAVWYVSSDRRTKENINYDVSDKLIAMFDGMKPCSFNTIADREMGIEQEHIGFIAQDVLEASENAGLGNATVGYDTRGHYRLNYGELTAMNTAKIKQLEARIEALEG